MGCVGFDIKQEKAIIEAGSFWCSTCLAGKGAGEQSPDPRYCLSCAATITGEHKQPGKGFYWLDDRACVHEGYVWATELVPIEPTEDGRKRWRAWPICLGKETDILPVLQGEAPILEGLHPGARVVLLQILERSENERTDRTIPTKRSYQSGTRKVGGKRSRLMLDTRHRPPGARRPASTKRVPVRLP